MRKLPVFAAFNHVLRSTVHNLGFAWHLSWPWMVLVMPLNIAAALYGFTFSPGAATPSSEAIAITILIALVTMFAFSSMAVSWHRYILLDEVPKGMARLRADNTVWRYFGNTLLIILILGLGMVPVGLLAGILAALGQAGAVLAAPVYVVGFAVAIASFYRLSVKLPAVALERRDFRLQQAWQVTRGNSANLFALAVLFFLAVVVMALVLGLFAYMLEKTGLNFALFLSLALQIVFNWIGTIMGVTLLTSLYGFFAEKRDF